MKHKTELSLYIPALIGSGFKNGYLRLKKQLLFSVLLISILHGMSTTARSHPFTIDQPKLQSPVNHESGVSLYPTLQWKMGSGSTANLVYDIYLGTNVSQLQLIAENFTDGSFNDSSIMFLSQDTFNLFYVNPLPKNTVYYWKVVAKDNTGASVASEVWDFTTGSPNLYAPDPPNYVSPANNAVNTAVSPLLAWQESIDADGDKPVYDLYLSTTPSPATLVAANISAPSFQINTPLKGNTSYYWKVVARDPGGLAGTGSIWKFTTRNNAPGAVTSLLPANQAANINHAVTLSWQNAVDVDGDAVSYEVWYGAGVTPDRFQFTTNNSLSLILAAGTAYSWKVVAIDSFGDRTESAVYTFTTGSNTGNTAPAGPTLLSPANNSTGILFQQTLQWNAATDNDQDAVYYTVYMGTDGISMTPVASRLTGTSYSPVLQAGKTYYWKVAASDEKGGITESSTWQFTATTQDIGITNLRVYYRYSDPSVLYKFESAVLHPVFTPATPAYITRGRTTIKDAIAIVLDYTDPNTVVSFDLPTGFTSTSNIIYNNGLPAGATKYYQVEGNFANHNTITVHLQNGTITRSYTIDAQINQKPAIPVLQQPAAGAANVMLQPAFTWSGGDDADGSTVIYRLYLGTSTANLNSAGLVSNKKSITSTAPLAGNQKYYWKIIATDTDAETVESDVFSFTTQAAPLTAPLLLYPRETSTYVEPNVTLTWKYLDDPGITYDIYLDKNNTPQRITQGVSGNSYSIQNLAPNTAYYWKVVAIDQQGVHITSNTGQFITKPANGNETGTFTDIRDGQIYQWVRINDQKWMVHNLAYKPQAKDGYYNYEYFNTGANAISYVALNNNSANISKYGYLYNWNAALNFDSETDTAASKQGVCPCGWHVATPADWQTLTPLNANFPATVHYSNWTVPGKENDWLNTSGLSLTPSGYYSVQTFPPSFQTNGYQFWLANNDRTKSSQTGYTWNATQQKFITNNNFASGHASVRCVKNAADNHAPGKPILQSPLNNSTHVNYSMQLQWTPASDADGDAITYDLYADTLPEPAQLKQSGITGTSFQLTEAQPNKTYYWKVRARDTYGEVMDSDVWAFATLPNTNTAPAALQLLLPANGSTGITTSSVSLTWVAATDADGDAVTYNLYFGKQPAALPLTATNITATGYTLTNLNSSTTYYWKIVAIDGHGGVTESSIHHFTTINHAPTAPVLLTPSNNINGIKELQLTWAPATDADGDQVYYRLVRGTDPNALSASGEITETYSPFGGNAILPNTVYYWQVIATDRKGGETASELRQFTTYKNEFANPGLTPVTPPHYGTGVSLTPSLSWTKPVSNARYDVYVEIGNGAETLVAENITDTPFVLNHVNGAPLQPHRPYNWKVVPKDASGNIYKSDVWQFTTRNSVPGKPVPTLPANGATGLPYSVTLNWLPAGDADGDLLLYDVYLGTSPNPTTLLAGDLQQTTYTTPMLTPNSTYYWKVIVKDGFGGSITSDGFSFTIQNNTTNTAPEAPRLVSPLAYQSSVAGPVTLQWDAAFDIDGDALVYDVYFGTSASPVTPVATGLSHLQYTPAALINGITYYWKVVARDGKGGETASPIWNFTAKNNAPTAPVLVTPTMSTILTGTNTALTWSAAQDADNDAIVYDVYLDKNPQPVTRVANGLTTLSFTTPSIDNNGIYYWRVVARDALGAETASTVFTFTGRNEAPSAPVLQLPANNSPVTTTTATLVWNASTDTDSDPVGYDVYLGTSPAALQIVGTVYTTSFTTGTLTANTTYYWKVAAKDKQNGSTETAVWSFTNQPVATNQPPGMPQLVSPANQSTAVTIQQTVFNWTAVTDPENDPVTYDLYVSTDNQATVKIAGHLTTTGYTLSSLAPGTTYYWKIIAKDDHGNSTASAIWPFTTEEIYTATNDPVLDEAIKISPNPTRGLVTITLPELLHNWNVELYNTNGYKLHTRIVNGYTRKLELFIPGKGIHFIRLTNNRRTVVRKVVVM